MSAPVPSAAANAAQKKKPSKVTAPKPIAQKPKAPKPSVSMVLIREEQFDKFAEHIQAFDYENEEFNIFISVEIMDKRSASQYWLKHLRDQYAKVFGV